MTATGEACSACGHANTPDARFCSGCGTELVRRCSACNAPQPPDSRFCNQCGSALTATTSASSIDEPIADAGASRKEVTLLFADLVGSTAFGELVDPEAARATLSRFFEILRRSIEVHGGTVAKFMGDGVMAVFGVPEMAEDDAHRAVLAGLEIQQQFGAFADMVRRRHDASLGLRIGINTGEVVIAEGDDDMIGDAINTAARIEAACTPGSVLVGEPTWRLTRSSIRYRDHGDVDAKGKSEPLATFEAESTRTEGADDTPFVGRSAELSEIRTVAAEVTAERRVLLTSVIGPPGVGKTRLAGELVLEGDARTFDVRIERRQSTTFAPIADLIRHVVGIPDGLGADDEQAAIRPLVARQADGEQLVTSLTAILAGGGGLSTEQLFTTVRRLLEVIGSDGPITIVFDDVQWAEPLFWDLLDHLVEWTTGVPVLMVALARPELRDLRPALCQPGRTVARSITLDGLQPDETEQLAARILQVDAIPIGLRGRLPTSTDGNPLFVREFVQMLVDDGVLERDEAGTWHLTIEADAIEVPPTIQSLLASRIERLDPDQRRLVEFASVIGTEFDRGVLVALAGPGTGPAIRRTLDSLQHMELIAAVGLWSGDEPVYRFHHVLIRDAAYRRMLKGRRAELHLAAAKWIGDQAAGSADEIDVAVGYHLERAHRYRTELGSDDDETTDIGRRAADLLGNAAVRALDRDDLQSSSGLVLRALECTGSDDPRLPELLLVGCEALLSTGDVTRGAELVAALEALDAGERVAAWTTCFRSQLITLTDPDALDRAGADAESAAAQLAALDDQAGLARARIVRAGALGRLGRIGDCEAELDLALTAARSADARRNITAVLGAAPVAALWGPSPVARAGGRCLDVLRLLRITSSSPSVEATSIRCQAVLEALRGRFDSARTMIDAARGICEENGIRQGLLETTFYAGLVELFANDPAAAEGHLRRAYDEMGQLGLGADAGQAAAHLARALLLQDRVDEADEMARTGEQLAGRNPQTGIVVRAVRAEVLSAQGRHDDAIRLAEAAVAVASVTDILVDHASALRALARVREAAGHDEAARVAAEMADAICDAKGATGLIHDAAAREVSEPADDILEGPPAAAGTADDSTVPDNRAASLHRHVDALMLAGDIDAIASMHAADAQLIDHRSMTGMELAVGRDEMLASLGQVMRGLERFDVRTLATRGDSLVLSERTAHFAVGAVDFLHVTRWDEQGLLDLVEIFDADRIDDARRRLDELGDDLAQNRADSVSRRAWSLLLDGDLDALAALHSQSMMMVDHRAVTAMNLVGLEENMASIRQVAGALKSVEVKTLAVRGDRLVLSRLFQEYGVGAVEILQVVRIDGDGLLDLIEMFEGENADAAHRRLDELADAMSTPDRRTPSDTTSRASGPSTLATRTMDRWTEAFRSDDFEAMRRLAAESATIIDRRPVVGLNERRPFSFFVESIKFWRSAGLGTDSSLTVDLIAVRGEHLAMHVTHGRTEDGSTISLVGLAAVDDDGLYVDLEFFAIDDLATALKQLDDRAGELGGEHTMTARCAETIDRFAIAALTRDTGDALALLDPAFTRVDHRRLALDVEFDAPEFTETIAAYGDLGMRSFETKVLATWRDRLLLAEHTMVSPSGDSFEVITVGTFHPDSGLWTRSDSFDRQDAVLAVEAFTTALQRLLADGSLAPGARVSPESATTGVSPFASSRSDEDIAAAYIEPDPAVAEEVLDELVAAEMRTLGLVDPTTFALRQADEVAALFDSRDHDGYTARLADGFTHSDRRTGAHLELDAQGQTDSNHEIFRLPGARLDREHLAHRGARWCAHRCTISGEIGFGLDYIHISEFSLDGLLQRAIVIDDDPEHAEQVLDELVEAEMRTLDLVNTATMAEQRDRGTCDTIAITMDHLALVRRNGRPVIIRTDDDGVVTDVETFDSDQLAEAGDQLTLLGAASSANTEAIRTQTRVAIDLSRVINGLATDTPFSQPDLEFIDHRPLGWGPASTFDDRVASLEQLGTIRQLATKTVGVRDGRLCVAVRQYIVTTEEFAAAPETLVVFGFDPAEPSRILTVHQFSTDQLDEALAYFDGTVSAADGPRPATVQTYAARACDELAEIFERGAVDDLATLAVPTYTVDDRRSGAQIVLHGEAAVENFGNFRELAAGISVEHQLVGTRGARICAHRQKYTWEDGSEIELIAINRLTLDGRFEATVFIDPDDELAERVMDELVEAEMRTIDLVNTATMAEQRDRETCDTIAVHLDAIALIRRNDQLVIIESDDHASISDVETFPLDQLASAGHRLEAMAMESERLTDVERRQGEAAAELGRFFNGAGDSAMDLDPRLEMVDHRPLGWGASTVADRASSLDAIGSWCHVTAKTIAHRPGRLCVLERLSVVTEDEFENATDSILVFDMDVVDEPRAIGIHQFSTDQLDEALAYFDGTPIVGEDQLQ